MTPAERKDAARVIMGDPVGRWFVNGLLADLERSAAVHEASAARDAKRTPPPPGRARARRNRRLVGGPVFTTALLGSASLASAAPTHTPFPA